MDDAARLPRLPRVASLKSGPTRNHPVRIVWHDTPDAALHRQGLAASEQRGVWRLEQVGDHGDGWAPGCPCPVLAQSDALAGLTAQPPSRLAPIAAFEGRAISLELVHDGEPVSVQLLHGRVRGSITELRAARIRISGAESAVFGLALALVEELTLEVPRAALASEALAAARAEEPAPRRLGAPTLPPRLSVAEAFAHATGHLTDVILHWGGRLGTARADEPEPVHQMRVALRRLRSAMSHFPASADAPAYDAARRGLKCLAATLGPARDWDVFCSDTGRALEAAFPGEPAVAKLLTAAERRRAEHHRALRVYLRGAGYRTLTIRLAALSHARAWDAAAGADGRALLSQPLPVFASGVLARRLKRVQQAGASIDRLDPAALHEVRLLGKRLRYAAELFAPLWPGKAPRRFIRRLTRLQEVLGFLNDAAVATRLVTELRGVGIERALAIGLARGFLAGRHGQQRGDIARAWTKFRSASPFWI